MKKNEEQRERYRKLRQRIDSPAYRRRIRRVHARRREMMKVIRRVEKRLAERLVSARDSASGVGVGQPDGSLSSAWEWFLTWRLKLGVGSIRMWCDGVRDLRLTWVARHTVRVEGSALLGPAGETRRGCQVYDLKATVTVNARGRRLRTYRIVLTRGSDELVAKKAI